MIVLYSPSKFECFIAYLFSSVGIKIHVFHKNNAAKNGFLNPSENINNVELRSEDKIGLLKILDYPDESNIKAYLSSLSLTSVYQRASKLYEDIDELEKKLDLSLVSSLEYHSAGYVYAYYLSHRINRLDRLVVINCDIKSFFTHEYQIFDKEILQVIFPVGQLISILYQQIKRVVWCFARKKSSAKKLRVNPGILQNSENNIAVIFHQGDSYGKLYKKMHYFSSDLNSPLHWNNVLKCVVWSDENTPSYLFPLAASLNKLSIFEFFRLVPFLHFLRCSMREKRAFIIIFYNYLCYQAWKKIFENTRLKSVIIDYDILFPKPLSLALESLGIKTIALQERASASLYHLIYGVICDIYSFSGKIWLEYGKQNRSIICKKAINHGSWKNYYFSENVPKIKKMQFHREICGNSKNKKIVFLGYFLDDASSITNLQANKQFWEYISVVAAEFTNCSIFIRMKILDEKLLRLMDARFSSFPNIYISTDYVTDGLSYALCRGADAIISVQSSLADDALAYGKSVVLIDNLFSVNKICSSIYPECYRFLIARTSQEIVNLLHKLFTSDPELLAKYKELKGSLSATDSFVNQSDIPKVIEKALADSFD